jgi:hypothetical protein
MKPTNFTRAEVSAVLLKVYADPHRFIDVVLAAANRDEAVARIAQAFDLTSREAELPLDGQFRVLTRDMLTQLRMSVDARSDS